MLTLTKIKMFLSVHRTNMGLFILRIGLTFALVAHSANILAGVLPDGLNTVIEIQDFFFSSIELLCGIMILSGFLVSLASYLILLILISFTIFDPVYLGYIALDRSSASLFILFTSCLTVALVGPGKFVLNKRFGHIASSLRESGIDKEEELHGT